MPGRYIDDESLHEIQDSAAADGMAAAMRLCFDNPTKTGQELGEMIRGLLPKGDPNPTA